VKKIAFIPAKDYSRRLRNKNFLKVNRKFLLDILIEKILKTKKFDEIIVSTESKKIFKIKYYNKIKVIFREKKLIKKNTRIIDLVLDFINKNNYHTEKNKVIISIFYPTSVLIREKDIVNTLKLINKKDCYTSMIVTNFSHNIEYAFIKVGKYIKKLFINNSQQKKYASAGSIYCGLSNKIAYYKDIYTPKTKANILPLSRCIDVDIEDDFKILKALIRK
jgi:CMP-N,N'-diacetyllegionaminic acid synthase